MTPEQRAIKNVGKQVRPKNMKCVIRFNLVSVPSVLVGTEGECIPEYLVGREVEVYKVFAVLLTYLSPLE